MNAASREPTEQAFGIDVHRQTSPDLDGWIAVPGPASATERMRVYVEGYPARLFESLQEAFPAVAHVVGMNAFGAMTERYVERVRPRSYNLNHAGEFLVEFLSRDALGTDYPFLSDLAALEWRVSRAFHSFESAPIEPTSLATWTLRDWDRAVLHFQPSLALVGSAWPILDIWHHRETPLAEIDIDLRDRPQNVLVYRRDHGVQCVEIDGEQPQALSALLAGSSLGDVSRALSERDIDGSLVSTWFATWMRDGLIIGASRD